MLIPPHIWVRSMVIPPMILGEWVVIPLRSQVSSMVILPKILGEEYGYPTYNSR